MSNEPNTMGNAKQELVLERVFNAPRDLVFKVWTDPQHLAQWWGPKGYTTTVDEFKAQEGGTFLLHMHGFGAVIPTKGIFHDITPPERLVFTTTGFEDEAGNPQFEVLNTVTFEETNGKMKLTLQARIVRSTPAMRDSLAGMEEGWNQSLERLAETLKEMKGESI